MFWFAIASEASNFSWSVISQWYIRSYKVIVKDSIRLLLVSLDIGATGIYLVFDKTLGKDWLYEGNISVIKLLGSTNFLVSLIKVKTESSLRDLVRWNVSIKHVCESIASHR